jgi:TetR/AcrR family transcriptional regulator, lmrAB and yxaGH operons repressor
MVDTVLDPGPGTRERILRAALRLFRKHGYSGVGIKQILDLAQAPKGSLYHHFPGGKGEIAVAVVEEITRGLIGLFTSSRAPDSAQMIVEVTDELARVMQKTSHEICGLFTGFVAQGHNAPALAHAVADSYRRVGQVIAERLVRDGWAPGESSDLALQIVATLEGAALLSQVNQEEDTFRALARRAALLCERRPR